jgi:hypothetical protein
MNIAQIESNLQKMLKSFNKDSFIYDLLLAYGQPKASITRLQQGGLNLSKVKGEIAWKKKLLFKSELKRDLHELIEDLKADEKAIKHDPRFIVVTDFKTLLAVDRKTTDTLDVPITELAKHFDFFLPWAGMEKAQHQNENPADVKAAERMAKLYDEIKKDNPTKTQEEVHSLNVFLSRLLFCFFAEDTGIFEEDQFTNGIASHTQVDGSDLSTYLDKLFDVMNTDNGKRKNLPAYLDSFPYVNGGLFKNKHKAPVFTRRSRQTIIEIGELDWSAINPDIFGSMIQAVVTPEHRGGLGMHYTSVPNIMKVIEPLFLNELKEEYEQGKNEPRRLAKLLDRIARIKIFDPACGSGNFLIIAYKELRWLEMKIHLRFKYLKELTNKRNPNQLEIDLIPKDQIKVIQSYQLSLFSGVALTQFCGIELDDFAHEVAILSLWLAEHQMNMQFKAEFNISRPSLPLTQGGNVVHGNALRIDWKKVCPINDKSEIFIAGNPPYLGSKEQDDKQKSDMERVFAKWPNYKKLDYIGAWFKIGMDYIMNSKNRFAFVSTNSISMGEQVSILWPCLFQNKQQIFFAHRSFKWQNNAKDKAGVTVVIIGVRCEDYGDNRDKQIFESNRIEIVKNISPYLVGGQSILVSPRQTALSNLPVMERGSQPTDDGNLIFSEDEHQKLLNEFPGIEGLFRYYMGAEDFLDGKTRYCLWVDSTDQIRNIPPLIARVEACKKFRLESKKEATRNKAKTPYLFDERKHKETDSIMFPVITSEKREYIPIGFFDRKTVISNKGQVVYNAKPWIFGILTSKIHNVWIQRVAGRLETRIQYSNTLCYNTFPFPDISDSQKHEIEKYVFRILEARERHSEKTLGKLYDPKKMPIELKEAHHELDIFVESCYRSKPFENDEDRLGYLFKLYEQMIEQEKSKGTLFEMEAKTKKKKKYA